MSTKPSLAAMFALSFLVGCGHREQATTTQPSTLPRTNPVVSPSTTNLSFSITESEAIQIAKQEAQRRGRTGEIRISKSWFEAGEWLIGLKFKPYDEVGNFARVHVTTNGEVSKYVRGY